MTITSFACDIRNCKIATRNSFIILEKWGFIMTASGIMEKAKNDEAKIIENRRYLHVNAETGFDLANTKEYVKNELTGMGYEPIECGRAGLIVLAGGKKPGRVFMIRADMDALPINEESGVEFACNDGRMHACGHDMHTAMLLEAARILKEHEDEINGTIKLMFQPAEEIFEGSRDMIDSGLLENPHVDGALMIHVMAGMPFEPGTVIVSAPGVSAPAADYFEIKVQGKGCHGSNPNAGVDPVTVAAHIITALQEINARELALSEQAVLTIGTIHAGAAANVIPDTVTMGGTIRAYDEETRQFLKERMTEISKNIAVAFRASAEVSFGSGCPTLVNDKGLSESALKYTTELLGQGKVFSTAQLTAMAAKAGGNNKATKSAGSEDFAYVSHEVPSIMLALAAGSPDKGYIYPQHHPMVKFDESALVMGSAVYAYMAMRWLEDNILTYLKKGFTNE
jgi:hippurate hydrolase